MTYRATQHLYTTDPAIAIHGNAHGLPASDRREIVRDAILVNMGVRAEHLHPLAARQNPRGDHLAGILEGLDITLADVQPRSPDEFPEHQRDVARMLINSQRVDANRAMRIKRSLLTSADVIAVVQDAANYLANADTEPLGEHEPLISKFDLGDYKPSRAPRIEPGDLSKVEAGWVRPWLFALAGEMVSLETHGGTAEFTRESIINGQWFELSTIVREMRNAAIRTERDAIVSLLESNPVLADGVAMFDASRGNVMADPALPHPIEALRIAAEKLRGLTTPIGAALQTRPFALAMPAKYELDVNVRELADRIGLVLFFDSRLSAAYLLPDPAVRPVLGLGLLDGKRRYEVLIKRKWATDGWGVRILHDAKACPLSPYAVRVNIGAPV
jgi:hypothetical protein